MITKLLPKACHLVLVMPVLALFAGAAPTSAEVTYKTRILSGQPAPGTDRVFTNFDAPYIDGQGRIAFQGFTSITDRGLWSEASGSLSPVALDGQTAPGTAGVYYFLDTLNVNSAGKIAFGDAMRVGTGGVTDQNNGGIWSDASETLSLLLREGDAAPGTTGAVFEGLSHTPLFNDAGQIVFKSALLVGTGETTSANNLGIWSGTPGSLRLLARTGFVAPGTAGGVYSDGFDLALNAAGQTAFKGSLLIGTGGVTAADDEGIWSDVSGSVSLVARKGSAAQGTAGGVFDSFDDWPAINDAGHIAFGGYLVTGTGDVTSSNDEGIWSNRSGMLELVVRKGDAAPCAGSEVFSGLDSPVIDSSGQIVFAGQLSGPSVTYSNDEAIWYEGAGSWNMIAREGEAAPGTTGVFNSFSLLANNLVLNGEGHLAFLGGLRVGSGGVTLANDRGIWATNSDGQLVLVVREGDVIDVNNDPLIEDLRTINTVAFVLTKTGSEDGRATPFNDAGQIAFKLTFTNDSSSGLFVVDVDALPPPVDIIPGDIDGDGFVGIADLNIVLTHWNVNVGLDNPRVGDLSGDGFVGTEDMNVVLSNWNAGTRPNNSAFTSIPDPASLTLLVLSGLTLAGRRRRIAGC